MAITRGGSSRELSYLSVSASPPSSRFLDRAKSQDPVKMLTFASPNTNFSDTERKRQKSRDGIQQIDVSVAATSLAAQHCHEGEGGRLMEADPQRGLRVCEETDSWTPQKLRTADDGANVTEDASSHVPLEDARLVILSIALADTVDDENCQRPDDHQMRLSSTLPLNPPSPTSYKAPSSTSFSSPQEKLSCSTSPPSFTSGHPYSPLSAHSYASPFAGSNANTKTSYSRRAFSPDLHVESSSSDLTYRISPWREAAFQPSLTLSPSSFTSFSSSSSPVGKGSGGRVLSQGGHRGGRGGSYDRLLTPANISSKFNSAGGVESTGGPVTPRSVGLTTVSVHSPLGPPPPGLDAEYSR